MCKDNISLEFGYYILLLMMKGIDRLQNTIFFLSVIMLIEKKIQLKLVV